MRIERGTLGFFLTFLVLGGVLGSALGTLLVKLAPSLSVISVNLTGPVSLSLDFISFGLRITAASIVGMIVGIVIFLRV